LSGTVQTPTLDPILSIGQEVFLEPHDTVELAFLTAAASSRQEVLALIRRYRAWHVLGRAFDQARAQAEVELRSLGQTTTEQLALFQELLSSAAVSPSSPARRPGDAGGQPERPASACGLTQCPAITPSCWSGWEPDELPGVRAAAGSFLLAEA
jgi:hypothetical protein